MLFNQTGMRLDFMQSRKEVTKPKKLRPVAKPFRSRQKREKYPPFKDYTKKLKF